MTRIFYVELMLLDGGSEKITARGEAEEGCTGVCMGHIVLSEHGEPLDDQVSRSMLHSAVHIKWRCFLAMHMPYGWAALGPVLAMAPWTTATPNGPSRTETTTHEGERRTFLQRRVSTRDYDDKVVQYRYEDQG